MSSRTVWTCSGGHRWTEAELARLEALGEGECPWPWYADEPIGVVEPEVAGG